MMQHGDPARFALGFELQADPDSGGLPHVRASWGALQIWVGGRNLTAGRAGDGSMVEWAEVPLAPVVEWITTQWDPLLHEERLPTLTQSTSAAAWCEDSLAFLPTADAELDAFLDARAAWWARHSLGAALPEFRVPDVQIRRMNSDVELSWDDRAWRSLAGGVQLIEAPGAVRLPATEVAGVLYGWSHSVLEALAAVPASMAFAERVLAVLEQHARPKSPLTRLGWAAGQRLDAAARQVRSLMGVKLGAVSDTVCALLGVGHAGVGDEAGGLVTPLTIPAMLFKSANPRLSPQDLLELVRLARAAEGPTGDAAAGLSKFQRRGWPPSGPEAATQDGYEKALALRAALGVDDAAALMGAWDLETALVPRLGIRLEDVRLDDSQIDGVALCAADVRPTIAVNRSGRFSSTGWGRRMTIAHELCHVLHDMDADGRVSLVSNPWAPHMVERRANAFAAMLLLPPAALEVFLPRDSGQWTASMLQEAMRMLGVGRSTLTWHLYNLRWISNSERLAWVDCI